MVKVKVQKGAIKAPKTMKTMSAKQESRQDSNDRAKKASMMQPKIKVGRY